MNSVWIIIGAISGFITVPKSGNYKFKVQTDDGFRMKISDNKAKLRALCFSGRLRVT